MHMGIPVKPTPFRRKSAPLMASGTNWIQIQTIYMELCQKKLRTYTP